VASTARAEVRHLDQVTGGNERLHGGRILAMTVAVEVGEHGPGGSGESCNLPLEQELPEFGGSLARL